MKLKNVTVWLFVFASVLYVIGGLRDIFAPGFFNISPRIPSSSDIAMQFVLAGVFLAMQPLLGLRIRRALIRSSSVK